MVETLISPEVQSLIMLVIMALLLTMFYYAILKSLPPASKEVLTTRAVIKCMNNDFEDVRSFQKGMYVGKVLDEKCPKCSSQLFINRIFAENILPQKKEAGPSKG